MSGNPEYIARHNKRRPMGGTWQSMWRDPVCAFDWRIIRYWQSTMRRPAPPDPKGFAAEYEQKLREQHP